MEVILSITVLTHNQRELLGRCLDSILAQEIPFEYEILVSDDASSDGSYELAQEYAAKYPMIHAYSCNSLDFHPTIKSMRGNFNRCNALKQAKGKYVAHVDGDDFLLADSKIYQKQVELLEKHPDCSCCMANLYRLNEGEEISSIQMNHRTMFETGHMLKSEDYLRDLYSYYREHVCFVYRRRLDVDPATILGGYYGDNVITAFYLQYGDIVCLNDAGYVYVQYENSVWHSYSKNDYIIKGCAALYNIRLLPRWKPVYLSSSQHLSKIKDVVRSAIRGEHISDALCKYMSEFDGFLMHAFNRKLTVGDKLHLKFLWVLLRAMHRTKRRHPSWRMPWRMLDKLL